jgi:hypothetical protein
MAPGHQALAEGEFAEQFVAGRGLTAWFWNGKLAAAEFTDQPGDDARSAIHSTTVEAQLARAGSLCWSAVPPRIRPGCAFVLHAVVAPNGSTWLLELNAEAALTPAFYATLLADLLPSP